MSAPAPLWMVAVIRAWMSFWLMRSRAISAPACLPNSFACSSQTWSAAGTKCDHCSKCSRVPCANAGTPPTPRTPAAVEAFKKSRRVRRAIVMRPILSMDELWTASIAVLAKQASAVPPGGSNRDNASLPEPDARQRRPSSSGGTGANLQNPAPTARRDGTPDVYEDPQELQHLLEGRGGRGHDAFHRGDVHPHADRVHRDDALPHL